MPAPINDVWDFTIGSTATEERPWVRSSSGISISAGRLICGIASIGVVHRGTTYNGHNSNNPRPYSGSYYITFDYQVASPDLFSNVTWMAYQDLRSFEPIAWALFYMNRSFYGSSKFLTSFYPSRSVFVDIGQFNMAEISASGVTWEIFWKNEAKLINIRANYGGFSRQTGFFSQIDPLGGSIAGGAWGQPRFDMSGGGSIGAITGAQGLDDAWVDHISTLPPLSFDPIPPPIPSASGILPASTGKLSHARIIRGERTPEQAQNFHELMKEKVT